MCYQQQGLKWLKSSMMCPKRAEETESVACVWGHAVSSCLLARRYSVNIGDLYQGEPWLKVAEDMQKLRGIWCEIGNGTGFLQVWEKWCERNHEKKHRFWISSCNQFCAKIPFRLQRSLHAQVLGNVCYLCSAYAIYLNWKSSCLKQGFCFLLTEMLSAIILVTGDYWIA